MQNNIKIITKDWEHIDAKSIESYVACGGYEALKKVLKKMRPAEVVECVRQSGLQGRGGAGFPVGEKWKVTSDMKGKEKYFICNLDESEPGTYKDRMIAQKNPHQIIEGVAIACYGIGAKKAFIYLNGKFRQAELMLEQAICQAKEENFLGEQISGSDFNLEIEIFSGAGAYVCGEESALINSIEGVRGEPRFKPPYPCTYGLYGKPTVVNNAETMANISWIIINGAAAYKMIGTRQSPGTKLFCIDGAVKHPGLYEAPIGRSVYDLIYEYAGGIKSGCRYWFAQLGGASGRLIPSVRIDLIPAFDRDAQLPLGSGTLLVFDKNQDTRELILSWLNFFQRESCGKCVPCREGLFRLKAIFERNIGDCWNQNDLEDIAKLIWTLENTTFCPLGKFSVVGLQEAIKYKLIEF